MNVVRYHTERGHVVCLMVKRGRKFIYLIPMDSRGIKIRKVLSSEERYFTEVDTPLKKAKVTFRRAARNFGVTKSAKQYLRG